MPRERPQRKAAAVVNYAEQAASSESELEQRTPVSRARKGKPTQATAEHQTEKQRASGAPDQAYLFEVVDAAVFQPVNGELCDPSVTCVDFTKLLPVEIILEICSHLRSPSLYRLAKTNKRLYATLQAETGQAMWRRQLETAPAISLWFAGLDVAAMRKLPLEDGHPINPLMIAALYAESTCQLCGAENADLDLDLLARVCSACIDREAVPRCAVTDDDDLAHLHPASGDVIRITYRSPARLKPRQRRPPYVLMKDLYAASEKLEILQMEDDAARSKCKRATRSRWGKLVCPAGESSQPGDEESIDPNEDARITGLSPRVRKYVQARLERDAQWAKVSDWLMRYGNVSHDTKEEDREGLLFRHEVKLSRVTQAKDNIVYEGIFGERSFLNRIPGFAAHPLLDVAAPLTEEGWREIAPHIYAGIGRCIASNVLRHNGAQSVVNTHFNWDSLVPKLLKQPSKLSDQAWEYVRPEILRLVDKQKKIAVAREKVKVAADLARTKSAVLDYKRGWFRERWQKIRDAQPNDHVRAMMPSLVDFVELPSVRELYDDPDFAVCAEDDKADQARWSERFDAVLEEVEDYQITVRFEAIRTILAATSEISEEELDQLDIELLNEAEFGDAFFWRPSSWMHCSRCFFFGSLSEIYEHRRTRCPARDKLRQPPAGLGDLVTARADDGAPLPFELSLEVACAILSICELRDVDPNEPYEAGSDKFALRLFRNNFAWKNSPNGLTMTMRWDSVVHEVTKAAREAHARGNVLAVPEIVTKGMSSREWYNRNPSALMC